MVSSGLLRRVALGNNTEDTILHNQRRENLKSNTNYMERIGELGTTLAVTNLVYPSSVLQLLVTLNVVPSSLIHSTLMMEAICFSKTLVLSTAIRRRIPEDGILPCEEQNIPFKKERICCITCQYLRNRKTGKQESRNVISCFCLS
jgi:hypothetical protein